MEEPLYMNPAQFSRLSSSSQQQCLYYHGQIIDELETPLYFTSLFSIGEFYVEVFLCRQTKEVSQLRVQSDPQVLAAYNQQRETRMRAQPQNNQNSNLKSSNHG